MHALASLQQDHRTLFALTDALELFARAIARGAEVDSEDVGMFAYAFRHFADYLHYEKEEHVLLPFLSRHGFDWSGELFEQVRADHSQERHLIDVLHYAAEQQGGLGKDDWRRVASTAAELARVQRGLILKQDIELFPEVTILLAVPSLEQLSGELGLFDVRTSARALELRRMVDELAGRYCPSAMAH